MSARDASTAQRALRGQLASISLALSSADHPARLGWRLKASVRRYMLTTVLGKVATVLAVGLVVAISACGARDLYRNSLCERYGGASVLVTAEAWREQHEPEISLIAQVAPEKAYRVVGPGQSSTDINSRFAEEVRLKGVAPGVTEHDFRLVDKKTNVVLAKWIRYYTGSGGRPILPADPIPMAASCFASAKEYAALRESLRGMTSQ